MYEARKALARSLYMLFMLCFMLLAMMGKTKWPK